MHQVWPAYFSLSLCADVEMPYEGGHPLVWAAKTLYSYTIKIISSIIVVSITIIVSIVIIASNSIIIILQHPGVGCHGTPSLASSCLSHGRSSWSGKDNLVIVVVNVVIVVVIIVVFVFSIT